MVHRIIEFFLSIPAPLAILTVFLLTAGETAFLLGLILPGELTAIVGGAIASSSRVPLAGILAAGILGPATGDSIGYLLGRKYGRRYFTGKRRKNWARARQWLRQRGARAVFLGRFTPFLRSIVPPAAGASRMAYRRFLPWSVAAAILCGEPAPRWRVTRSEEIPRGCPASRSASAWESSRLWSFWPVCISCGGGRGGASSRAPSPRSDSTGGPRLFGASMKVRHES